MILSTHTPFLISNISKCSFPFKITLKSSDFQTQTEEMEEVDRNYRLLMDEHRLVSSPCHFTQFYAHSGHNFVILNSKASMIKVNCWKSIPTFFTLSQRYLHAVLSLHLLHTFLRFLNLLSYQSIGHCVNS